MPNLIACVVDHITQAKGQPFTLQYRTGIGGGCINQAFRLEGNSKDYFIKTNEASLANMFEAEYAGLQVMSKTKAIKVPEPTGEREGERCQSSSADF